MNRDTTGKVMWAVVIVAAAGALLSTVMSVFLLNEQSDRLKEYTKRYRTLQKMEVRAGRMSSSRNSFEQLSNPRPVPIDQILREVFANRNYDTKEKTADTLGNGWLLRRMEVSFQQVSMQEIATLLLKCEQGRPAWNLTDCSIRAQAKDGSTAQVRIVIEALEKSG